MRTPGGKRLTRAQWRALEDTELSAEKPDVPPGWYHTCYCWSITSMASFLVARQSADRANQTLFYVQAVDEPLGSAPNTSTGDFYKALLQVPNVSQTKKLPGVVLFHQNMRGRFTTLIQQPFAVQDVITFRLGLNVWGGVRPPKTLHRRMGYDWQRTSLWQSPTIIEGQNLFISDPNLGNTIPNHALFYGGYHPS